MKNVMKIVCTLASIVILILIIFFLSRRIPEVVLFKNGICQKNIVLTYTIDSQQRIYVYKRNSDDKKRIGVIKLSKVTVDSKNWMIRDENSKQSEVLNDTSNIFLTDHTILIDGKPLGSTLISGCVVFNSATYNNLDQMFAVKPTVFKIDEDRVYFIIDLKKEIRYEDVGMIFKNIEPIK